jgi:hypothetical protein
VPTGRTTGIAFICRVGKVTPNFPENGQSEEGTGKPYPAQESKFPPVPK